MLPDDRWAPGAAKARDARGAGANNHANAAAKIATAADARPTTRVMARRSRLRGQGMPMDIGSDEAGARGWFCFAREPLVRDAEERFEN